MLASALGAAGVRSRRRLRPESTAAARCGRRSARRRLTGRPAAGATGRPALRRRDRRAGACGGARGRLPRTRRTGTAVGAGCARSAASARRRRPRCGAGAGGRAASGARVDAGAGSGDACRVPAVATSLCTTRGLLGRPTTTSRARRPSEPACSSHELRLSPSGSDDDAQDLLDRGDALADLAPCRRRAACACPARAATVADARRRGALDGQPLDLLGDGHDLVQREAAR